MKRAGLDYWERLRVEVAESVEEWLRCETGPLFLFSSKARYSYTKARYPRNAVLVFGSETTGLPEMLWQQFPSQFYRIPMLPHERCLNLAVSTGIALYEALRQNEFPNTF
jgi:tRNA (cytidine/uridine-2'-O-)-methyltransferase